MHVYMYTCSCVYVHIYVGPEVDVQCLLPSLPTLFIEAMSLGSQLSLVYLATLWWGCSACLLYAQMTGSCHTCLALSGYLNSGLHAEHLPSLLCGSLL